MDEGRRKEEEDDEGREARERQAKKPRLEAAALRKTPIPDQLELPDSFPSSPEYSPVCFPYGVEEYDRWLELSLGPIQLLTDIREQDPPLVNIGLISEVERSDSEKWLELSPTPYQQQSSIIVGPSFDDCSVKVERSDGEKWLELSLAPYQQQGPIIIAPPSDDSCVKVERSDSEKWLELSLAPYQQPGPIIVGPSFDDSCVKVEKSDKWLELSLGPIQPQTDIHEQVPPYLNVGLTSEVERSDGEKWLELTLAPYQQPGPIIVGSSIDDSSVKVEKSVKLLELSLGPIQQLTDIREQDPPYINNGLTSEVERSDGEKWLELSLAPYQQQGHIIVGPSSNDSSVQVDNLDDYWLELCLGPPPQQPTNISELGSPPVVIDRTTEAERSVCGNWLELSLAPPQQQGTNNHELAPPRIIVPNFPWAVSNCPAAVQSISLLLHDGISLIRGELECRSCKRRQTVSLDLLQKYHEVEAAAARALADMRFPLSWVQPKESDCPSCWRLGRVRPVVAEDPERINWLFLFLDQALGECIGEHLTWLLWRNNYCHYGLKSKLVYNSYAAIGTQLNPSSEIFGSM